MLISLSPLYAITTDENAKSKTKTKMKLTLQEIQTSRLYNGMHSLSSRSYYKGRRRSDLSAYVRLPCTQSWLCIVVGICTLRTVTENVVPRRFDATRFGVNWTSNVGKPLVVTSLVVAQTDFASFKLRHESVHGRHLRLPQQQQQKQQRFISLLSFGATRPGVGPVRHLDGIERSSS